MSTPPVPQQAMMQFICSQCKGNMVAPQPTLRVFNAQDVAAIVCAHSQHKCPGCGTIYTCVFHPQALDPDGKLMFMWVPMQTKTSAIVPGTQGNMQQALQKQDLEKKIKIN